MPAKRNYWGKLCFLPKHTMPDYVLSAWIFFLVVFIFFNLLILPCIPKEYEFLPLYTGIVPQLIKKKRKKN